MRRATLRSEIDEASVVAAALEPDDTPEIDTRVEEGGLVVEIERESTRGLQSTLDDYVVNLGVAREVVQHANRHFTHDT